MQTGIIIATFVLGVLIAIVAIVALFKNKKGGEGSLKFWGIELSGKGAPILFLLVGATLVIVTLRWATSETEVETAQEEERKCLEETKKIHGRLSDQHKLTLALREMAPPDKLKTLPPDLHRALDEKPYVAPEPLQRKLERVRIR